MVRFHHQPFTYKHEWQTVTAAIWQKYPNPFARHVLTADVIERTTDPVTGKSYAEQEGERRLYMNAASRLRLRIMHTTRLFTKAGMMPKWGRTFFNVAGTAYIIEHSTIDPITRVMTTQTRNLSHSKLMLVLETQRIRPHHENPDWTVADTEAKIISNTAFAPLRGRVEEFGVSKFRENCIKSSNGLLRVIQRLIGKADPHEFAWEPL
ncbi:hypothetical protein SmJEL517_g01782 [Synchytrium microbalum]|uniref:PRELI/MSF1 domain-containing protein n=1 Tax=Synchytrium microbalum TaxID=1806994 RepID=A0A507CDB5_9FUNG|nr:uncharacterized protein SmJEL517_g01782 [Synchytrium microbalum]TPX35914.1 hypothetical protein SmJEL517_g01782 [Synchytrium microbalum]